MAVQPDAHRDIAVPDPVIAAQVILVKLVGQVFLGSEEFVARMQELLADKREIKEIPRSQRYPGRPSMGRIFADVRAGNRQQRNQRIAEAHIAYGYTLKEIADFLGVHYTTVSKAVGGRIKK